MIHLSAMILAAGLLDPKPTPLDYGLLAAAEVAIWADMSTTLDIKNHSGYAESNPILGLHPSDNKILLYGAACSIATAAVWLALPAKYRSYWSIAIFATETHAVYMNLQGGLVFKTPW